MSIIDPDRTPVDPDTGLPSEPALPDPDDEPEDPEALDGDLAGDEADADVLIDPDAETQDPEGDAGRVEP